MKSRYMEDIMPVPWYFDSFVKSRFHCTTILNSGDVLVAVVVIVVCLSLINLIGTSIVFFNAKVGRSFLRGVQDKFWYLLNTKYNRL